MRALARRSYVDRGNGFESEPLLEQETDSLEGADGMLRIPATAVALRFDPLDRSGPFQLGSVSVTQAALGVQLARALRPLWRRVRGAASRAARGTRAAGRLLVLRPAGAVARVAAGVVLALRPRARARALRLEPERQLAPIPGRAGRWHALGTEPRFRLTGAEAPRGWCRLTTRVSADAPARAPQLIARLRGDREVDLARRLTVAESGRVDGRVYVPVRATCLLWDPVGGPGEFEHAPTLELRPITAFPVADQDGEPAAAAGADSRSTSTGSSTSTPARY